MTSLSIASILLGLLAWLLPILSLAGIKKKASKRLACFTFGSFTAACISLLLQFFDQVYLVSIRDWSAIEDTARALAIAATLMVIVTVLLNFFSIRSARREKALQGERANSLEYSNN